MIDPETGESALRGPRLMMRPQYKLYEGPQRGKRPDDLLTLQAGIEHVENCTVNIKKPYRFTDTEGLGLFYLPDPEAGKRYRVKMRDVRAH